MNDPEGLYRVDKQSLIEYCEQLEADLEDAETTIDYLNMVIADYEASLWATPAQ